MKRKICIILSLMLCVFAFLPTTAYAKTYDLSSTDLTVSVDDAVWYVFTRDNLVDNPEIDELSEVGITYDIIYDALYSNNAYLYALLLYSSGEYVEFYVAKSPEKVAIANLSNYGDERVLELAKEIAKTQDSATASVYKNDYKFAKLEYVDAATNFYLCDFFTVVNKNAYTLKFQSNSKFTDEEYAQFESIIDSAKFNVDPSIKEPKGPSFFDSVMGKAIIGGAAGALVGGLSAIIGKQIKSHKKTKTAPTEENAETE